MPVIIDYVLKLSICLAVVYLFYQLFLRRLTFYNWNRWYLLGYSVLSFVIPLIDVMPELQKKELDRNALVQLIPVFRFAADGQQTSLLESLSAWDWVLIAGGIGSVVLLCRFSIMYLSFLRIKKRAQLISDDRTRIYQLDEDVRPFSFGNAIFVNTELHSGEELEEIIRHEFVHVRQKHTIDIVWSELLCILLWFNPFVWLLRKSLKQNLEFLADKQVLQNGMDKKEYQYLLLKVMGNKQFAFANHFNFSSLKNRIAMMNSIKSARVHLTKFLFLLPVVAVLLLAFRKEVIQHEQPALPEDAALKKSSDDIFERARQMAGSSHQPVWFIDGEAVVLGAGGGAVLDRDDVNGPDDFKIWADNKIMTMDEANKQIDRFKILSVGASPKSASFEHFGIRSNLLLMTTSKKMDDLMHLKMNGKSRDTVPQRPEVKLRMHAPGGTNETVIVQLRNPEVKPLLVVDGVKKPEQEWNAISPDNIESVSILKDGQATALYGNEGKNGVVLIVTKNGPAAPDSVKSKLVFSGTVNYAYTTGKDATTVPLKGRSEGIALVPANTTANNSRGSAVHVNTGQQHAQTLFFSSNGNGADPLYMIDGKPANSDRLKAMAPDKIQAVSVLKDAAAQKTYGEAAKNGVVLITTKKDAASPSLKEVVVTGYGIKEKQEHATDKNEHKPTLKPVVVTGYRMPAQEKEKAPAPEANRSKPGLTRSVPVAARYSAIYNAHMAQSLRSTASSGRTPNATGGTPSPNVRTEIGIGGGSLMPGKAGSAGNMLAKNESIERYKLQLRYTAAVNEAITRPKEATKQGQRVAVIGGNRLKVADTLRIYDRIHLLSE
ncbi:TonB-dependent receptor plug domain-containing protein [Niabella pedocola]|uniref:TonB-dependent receptor plug domain-containing protein n=1 Tax=Niabella pedocola TaxID=1752077 RepID=A0ABS8PXP7_9BACT|nr:M56 family metallopeptidase [Niabella pedocola]MCD2425833.1 TonB-dependent receptor plug domain-containing protein [Niabella pedocola]